MSCIWQSLNYVASIKQKGVNIYFKELNGPLREKWTIAF